MRYQNMPKTSCIHLVRTVYACNNYINCNYLQANLPSDEWFPGVGYKHELKLLVFAVLLGAVYGRCPQGKYWSKVLSECVPCSKCTQSYLLRACTPEKDSVCADEIRLTLDWLHPEKKVHHFSKDRLSAIEHDLYNASENDDDDLEDISDDLPIIEKKKPKHYHFQQQDETKSKHKKHKKHYEFDDTMADKEYKKKDKWHKKKISVEDEKALEDWLKVSEDRLKHRKQDLLRTLKHSKIESKDMSSRRLNQPNRKVMSDILNGLVKHELHRDGASELLAELELANKQHQIQDDSEEEEEDTRENNEDEALRLIHLLASHDSPHRLFPGQPSTVSEIIGQVKEDGMYKSNVVLEKSNRQFEPDDSHLDESVVAEPFNTAEALVWDWQAVALVSAVAACLLFFVIAAIYSLLSARDTNTKRIPSDHDGEEMTTMVALMPSSEDQDQPQHKRPIVQG